MHVTKLITIPLAVFTAAAVAAPKPRSGPWRKINRPVKAEVESQNDIPAMNAHAIDKRKAKGPGDRWGYNEAQIDDFDSSKPPPVINVDGMYHLDTGINDGVGQLYRPVKLYPVKGGKPEAKKGWWKRSEDSQLEERCVKQGSANHSAGPVLPNNSTQASNSTESPIHPRWFWGNSPKKSSYPNTDYDHYPGKKHRDHYDAIGCNRKHPNLLLDNFRHEGRSVPFNDTEYGLLNETTETGSCSCNRTSVAATLDDNENGLVNKATNTSAAGILPRGKICKTCGWDHEEGSPKPSRNPSITSTSSRSTVPVNEVMDSA